MDDARKKELLESLVGGLCVERGYDVPQTDSADELWTAFRALVNTRPPIPADPDWLSAQDELLRGVIEESGIRTLDDMPPSPVDSRLRLWRGDITTLAVDAIVNAANSQMLGCWVPGHHCIDNAIHTFAGVQLRAECDRIMKAQGHEEPTGTAKITPAYNLPAKYVIHTVGPIANGRPNDLHSIAFCCISTGVFGFPQEEAARIAVRTVREWLDEHEANMIVVFNVFMQKDESIYGDLLA